MRGVSFDYWTFIPTKTAIQLMGGKEAYNIIVVEVSDPEQSEQMVDAIEEGFDNSYAIGILVRVAFMRQVDHTLNSV